MYADMADGDSKDSLKAHLDARVDIYLRGNAQPSWIHPHRAQLFLAGGAALSLLGVSSLLIDDLDVEWSLTLIGAGIVIALIGCALAAQAGQETRRAEI